MRTVVVLGVLVYLAACIAVAAAPEGVALAVWNTPLLVRGVLLTVVGPASLFCIGPWIAVPYLACVALTAGWFAWRVRVTPHSEGPFAGAMLAGILWAAAGWLTVLILWMAAF